MAQIFSDYFNGMPIVPIDKRRFHTVVNLTRGRVSPGDRSKEILRWAITTNLIRGVVSNLLDDSHGINCQPLNFAEFAERLALIFKLCGLTAALSHKCCFEGVFD